MADNWKPFNAGFNNLSYVWTIGFHPVHPNEIFAGVDHDGLYQSNDGKSWKKIPNEALNGSRITGIVFNPKNSNEIYVSNSRGLYHSLDHGQTWETLLSEPDSFFSAIALNFDKPSELYLLNIDGQVFKSKDNGKSWVLLLDTAFEFRKIWINPLNSNHLVVFANQWFSSESFLYQSTNAGQTWEKLPIKNPNNFAFSPTNKNQLYVVAEFGLMRSDDLGKTWSLVFQVAGNKANAILINDVKPEEMFLNVKQQGIYKSEDSGENWHLVDSTFKDDEDTLPTMLMNATHDGVFLLTDNQGLWFGDHHGKDWNYFNEGIHALSVNSLANDATNDQMHYAGTDEDLWIMRDGKTWTKQLKLGKVQSIFINPAQSSNVLAEVNDKILYSTDHGKTWQKPVIQYGDANLDRFEMRGVAYSPLNPSEVFSLIHYQAGFSDKLETFVSKSNDDGKTWYLLSRLNEKTTWMAREAKIVFNPKNPQELYLAVLDYYNGVFIYKSNDTGKSWQLLSNDFKKFNFNRLSETKISLNIDSNNPATLYFAYANQIYKTTDAGATWFEMHQGLPDEKNFNTLIIDSKQTNRLFLGAVDISANSSAKLNDSQNIFVSNDSGATWLPFAEGLTNPLVSSLTMNANYLFATTKGSGIFVRKLS